MNQYYHLMIQQNQKASKLLFMEYWQISATSESILIMKWGEFRLKENKTHYEARPP